MQIDPFAVARGASNLLTNAAGVDAGDRLLIVHEDPRLDYYDSEMVAAVAAEGRRMGAVVSFHQVAFEPLSAAIPVDLQAALRTADKVIFLARIGDQMRFADMGVSATVVVSYALDSHGLGSPFGTADHRAFVELKSAIDEVLANARTIHVTCPAGTDFRGPGSGPAGRTMAVGISRFPMPVFTPLPAAGFAGTVALPGFLVGTGSMYYQPYGVEYSGALFAHFVAGRLTHFSGDVAAVHLAEAHYQYIADTFAIDERCVHSWHAGIHPGCEFFGTASASYEKWSGSAFGNPRLLHFHTCGDYAPGEISWNVIDPTITIDGSAIWQSGHLNPMLVPGGGEILAKYPSAKAAFDLPGQNIGVIRARS
ncbi:hypothetical protein ACFFTN_15670 [Aminobacter aganoensis]|uniref:Uncharacterized protein n=1 Tax=Aminobacter aganoensis TaxID=83264 RepID=A0A7X0KP28_9HYPH|nr:hypothetical protein [Aminobacter aganoensis]MBB6357792.1 hypothetical protein [Aminobacter aganoensis]